MGICNTHSSIYTSHCNASSHNYWDLVIPALFSNKAMFCGGKHFLADMCLFVNLLNYYALAMNYSLQRSSEMMDQQQ